MVRAGSALLTSSRAVAQYMSGYIFMIRSGKKLSINIFPCFHYRSPNNSILEQPVMIRATLLVIAPSLVVTLMDMKRNKVIDVQLVQAGELCILLLLFLQKC